MKDIKMLDRRGQTKPELQAPKRKDAGEQVARLQPCEDWILVDLKDEEARTPAGLILPNGIPGQARRGIVLAVGPGKAGPNGDRLPMNVRVGDEVLAPSAFGAEMDFEGESCFLMRDAEVLAIVKPAKVTT